MQLEELSSIVLDPVNPIRIPSAPMYMMNLFNFRCRRSVLSAVCDWRADLRNGCIVRGSRSPFRR